MVMMSELRFKGRDSPFEERDVLNSASGDGGDE